MVTLKGRILSMPRMESDLLSFSLKTEAGDCRIVRMDPIWQKRDILFLCAGQEVTVMGEQKTDCLVARQILITNCRRRIYPVQSL